MSDPIIERALAVIRSIESSKDVFLVAYRISGIEDNNGQQESRRSNLVKKLSEFESAVDSALPETFVDSGHLSTSVWLVHFDGSCEELGLHLSEGLSSGVDRLEISQFKKVNLWSLSDDGR